MPSNKTNGSEAVQMRLRWDKADLTEFYSLLSGGHTANLCAIDLSKAFDKVNKWNNSWSEVFKIDFGVRQGSVLSQLMFALYVDDLGKLCELCRGCCIILYADDILLIAPTVTYLVEVRYKTQ